MSTQDFVRIHAKATENFQDMDFDQKVKLVDNFMVLCPGEAPNTVNLVAFMVSLEMEVA